MESTGQRIRYWRRRRGGMSQRVLAGLAGVSQAYVSQIESGARALDRRATQVAFARALNITVSQLLGLPGDPTDPAKAEAASAGPGIRSAIMEINAGERPEPSRPLDAVRAAVRRSTMLRNAADYAGLAPGLAELLRDAYGYGGPEFVEATFNARFLLKGAGYPDLALAVAETGLRVARELDLPEWIGLAEISRLNVFPPEDGALTSRVAMRAARELQGRAGDPAVRHTYGNLLCRAAVSAGIAGDAGDARACLDEARLEARTLGESDDGGFGMLWFGPTSVGVWGVSVATELGDIDGAIGIAETVDPTPMRAPNRVVYYWTDYGRALATVGKDAVAVSAFSQAEMVDPQRVRMDPMVRDSVAALVHRARRRAVPGQLLTLAHRIGIAA